MNSERSFLQEDPAGLPYHGLTETLHRSKSNFQEIEVVQTKAFGKMLILDRCVMLTERDEFVYHEMITHVPVLHHPNPRRIVVIGGGDGGTVGELLKYPEVEKVTLCEIDGDVIDVCRTHFPDLTAGLDDPRVEVIVDDGVAYIEALKERVDLVIVDSTDPVGLAEGLVSGNFYNAIAGCLGPNGMVVTQSGSPWFSAEEARVTAMGIRSAFPTVKSYVAPIPTYPLGLWSWCLGSLQPENELKLNRERFAQVAGTFKYLTPALAANIFEIPPFYAEKLRH